MMLTQAESLLLEAVRAGVRDEHVNWSHAAPEDWAALLELAAGHKLLPLVYEAVYACPAAGEAPLAAYKGQAMGQVAAQTRKTREFLSLYAAMEAAGLHPLVVKGLLCRGLYPHGDYRLSGDEDLLLGDEEFAAACRLFREQGLAPMEQNPEEAWECGWHKPGGALYIELHRRLFSPEAGAYGHLEDFFSGAPTAAYPVEGGTVQSLAPHEHLLYLLLHAYKHFIHSGFGIRQACDIGLWARTYAGDIDWERLYRQCAEAGALTFAGAVFGIARDYLGVEAELPGDWAALRPDGLPMLKDLLSGGVYGSADKSRVHSATVTLNAVEAQRRQRPHRVLRSVFPSRGQLEGRYPLLKKHPALLPAVWCARLVRYGKETVRRSDSSALESLRIAKERTELLKRYDILQ